MGAQHELDPDWLNDAVEFLHGEDPGATVLFERPGLTVSVASLRYLLAMKLLAARVERDEDDIVTLARFAGLDTVEDILDVVATAYPDVSIPARVQFLFEELFQTGA